MPAHFYDIMHAEFPKARELEIEYTTAAAESARWWTDWYNEAHSAEVPREPVRSAEDNASLRDSVHGAVACAGNHENGNCSAWLAATQQYQRQQNWYWTCSLCGHTFRGPTITPGTHFC